MATKPSSFDPDQVAAKHHIMIFQMQNMLRKHAKPFAILLKILLENERRAKKH